MKKPPKYSPGLFGLLKIALRAKKLKRHEKWTREQIKVHQQSELKKLREFAYTNSSFYKRFHKGFEDKPLHELPILTKKELMANWDDLVTDRSLNLKDVDNFLNNVTGLEAYKGKYFAFATGGTTGVKGISVLSKDEFLHFFSLTARASGWTGMHLPFGERPRMATVQSHLPWHVAGAAGFIKLPVVKVLALDTVEPLEQLVSKLNKYQPHLFGGYASNVHLLALEQIAGRLDTFILCILQVDPLGVYYKYMKPDIKKNVMRRLKVIEGQVRGLQKMLEEEKYCVDVITQSSAIRHSLGSVENLMMENHLTTHVIEQMKKGQHKKASDEILAVYKLARLNK